MLLVKAYTIQVTGMLNAGGWMDEVNRGLMGGKYDIYYGGLRQNQNE